MDEKSKLRYVYFNRLVHFAYDCATKISSSVSYRTIPLCQQEYSPFFIVGSGRSGSTLLRTILGAGEGIVIPPETYVLGKLFRLHGRHKKLDWETYVNLMISTFEYHPQFFTFEIDSLRDLALELKNIEEDKRSLADIVHHFYLFYARKKDMHMLRWGDKTPLNAMYVYRLRRVFPNAQFVHMIRDGVDVVHSYVQAGLYEDYRTAATRWRESVKFLRRFGDQHASSYYEIRYEQLVQEPEETLERLCRFLMIPFAASMMTPHRREQEWGDIKYIDHHANVLNDIATNSIGKGRRALSRKDVNDIKPIINSELVSLGYEPL